jgi:hypothetical protein
MPRKILYFYLLLMALSNHEAYAESAWLGTHPSIIVGAGETNIGGAQNLWLANTPEPGLQNNYTING